MTAPLPHLSWDDLDDLLMGTERQSVHVHFETCAACRKLASLDLEAVVQLQRLPALAPRPGFADRVMAGLATGAVPIRSTTPLHTSAWLKAAAVMLTLGGIGASVSWSLANQSLLQSWRVAALERLAGLAQTGLAAVAMLPEAAMVTALRDSLGGVGMGLAVTGVATAYLAGVLLVQRLVALPRRPVPDAV